MPRDAATRAGGRSRTVESFTTGGGGARAGGRTQNESRGATVDGGWMRRGASAPSSVSGEGGSRGQVSTVLPQAPGRVGAGRTTSLAGAGGLSQADRQGLCQADRSSRSARPVTWASRPMPGPLAPVPPGEPKGIHTRASPDDGNLLRSPRHTTGASGTTGSSGAALDQPDLRQTGLPLSGLPHDQPAFSVSVSEKGLQATQADY